MKEQKKTLQQLSEGVIEEMKRLHYLPSTIQIYRKTFQKIIKYASENQNIHLFSEELGKDYLKEVYGFPGCKVTPNVRHQIRCIKKLGEFQLYNAFIRVGKTIKRFDWSEQDQIIIQNYIDFIQSSDTSEATKKLRTNHIKSFYNFLGAKDISGICKLTPTIISDYVKYMHTFSMVYVKHRLSTLRYYFRFLYNNNFCEIDWSYAVPRVVAPVKTNLPALWTKEDIEKLLNIDRGNPLGRRNYAILILVTKLGIRIQDLINLKLEDLKWNRNEIEFAQHKTGNKVIYPMLKDIGWAIIDYIKYSRPQIDSQFLFLSVNAPFTPLSIHGINHLFKKQMRICGITKQRNVASGIHSLRHALARKLMEQDVPLKVISDIMGHTCITSSSPYLNVDIEGLRICALNIKGIEL